MANAALYLTELVQESANAQQYDILLTKILGYGPLYQYFLIMCIRYASWRPAPLFGTLLSSLIIKE
jgi:hypothetical protein